MGIFSAIFGNENTKKVKQLEKIAARVEALDEAYRSKTDEELQSVTPWLKERFANGEPLDDLLPDAFAAMREAAGRVLNMRHFHVQLLGGIALHQGRIAEMSTGEGKTLVATLPAYLNAISGKGVHIVTVNDYLAKRDAEWMGKVYRFLGLTVGVVLPSMNTLQKQEAYACDVVYATNNELGFDYLRDNMAVNKAEVVQRPLNFAIVDEVDSILIDEARTPLIISGRGEESTELYQTVNRFVKTLKKGEDYELDEKEKAVRITESGIAKAESYFRIDNFADIENTTLNHHVQQALKAHAVMKRDSDYIVENGEIVIVDEFTGRKMEGRRFSAGLHQAIEAKENVRVRAENKTLATITFQNFFRLYHKLSGMTGTAKTEEGEFNAIYQLDVVQIPTNRPNIRIDYDDIIYSTRKGKLKHIADDVAERAATGQPILIGTITVEKSEELSKLLMLRKVKHNVLNAKNHEREAEIVAQAGRLGAVTIATNMAGRGTDILLGGNPDFLAKQEMLRKGYNQDQISKATSYAEGDEETKELQRVYRTAYEAYRQHTEEEKQKVVELGGLHIIGTERHDSRRIDNQLRGRAGRQGDPGSSVFFLSLEDDLARVFGGEAMQRAYSFLKIDEDTPISQKMITRAIENAQKRIEGQNFASRKYVLQYDDVMNYQRKLIYEERNKVLNGEDVHEDIRKMIPSVVADVLGELSFVSAPLDEWDAKEVNDLLKRTLLKTDVFTEESRELSYADFAEIVAQKTEEALNARFDELREMFDFKEAERFILLKVVDQHWMDHLDTMEQLKRGIGLRAFGNHDPIVAYKNEGYDLFEKMVDRIKRDTVSYCLKAEFSSTPPKRTAVKPTQNPANPAQGAVSRNSPCPCGSGKKYKHCCGKNR